MLQEFPEATILRPSDIVGEEAKFYNVYLQKGIKVSFFGLNNIYVLKTVHVVISYTLEPRYNTIRYNTNSDITRMRFGPQFFPNLPFFISLERKYVFQTC